MPPVPNAVQNVINTIDAQIQKERSPIVNVILGVPLFIIVSLPIAFLAGAIALIVIGTNAPMVSQNSDANIVGFAVGGLVMLIFVAWSAYATYSYSS